MHNVFPFLLDNFSRVFSVMSSFQIFPGLNLLQFLIICLLIDVCFSLFFGHMPRVGADSAMASLARNLRSNSDRKGKD